MFIDMRSSEVVGGARPPLARSERVGLHLGQQGQGWLLVGGATVQVQLQSGRGRRVQEV